MAHNIDESRVNDLLRQLPVWKQTAFVLSICERLLPNFALFANETGHPGQTVLRSAINTAWSMLLSGETRRDLSSLAEQCAEVAPDSNDFESLYVSSALDAAAASNLLMLFATDNLIDHALEAAGLALDTVDMYVQELEHMNANDAGIEAQIHGHPLMQQEIGRQIRDIQYLADLDENIRLSAEEARRHWSSYADGSLVLR